MNMIPVTFHSNKDSLKFEEWPTKLVCRPVIGDLVKSISGKYGQIHTICHKAEHCKAGSGYFDSGEYVGSILHIELIEI